MAPVVAAVAAVAAVAMTRAQTAQCAAIAVVMGALRGPLVSILNTGELKTLQYQVANTRNMKASIKKTPEEQET
jgi:hypothetical protein